MFFFTVYGAGLIFIPSYTAFLNFLEHGPKRIPLQIKPQVLGILILAAVMHLFVAAEGAHKLIQTLADQSGTLRLLRSAILAGLLEILAAFVFLCVFFFVVKSIGLQGNLGIVVMGYLCVFFRLRGSFLWLWSTISLPRAPMIIE